MYKTLKELFHLLQQIASSAINCNYFPSWGRLILKGIISSSNINEHYSQHLKELKLICTSDLQLSERNCAGALSLHILSFHANRMLVLSVNITATMRFELQLRTKTCSFILLIPGSLRDRFVVVIIRSLSSSKDVNCEN